MDKKKFKDLKKIDKIITELEILESELEILEYVFSKKGHSNCTFYIDKPCQQLSIDFEVLKPVLLDIIRDKLAYYKKLFETM